MKQPGTTVRERIHDSYGLLTKSERKFAGVLLEDYPSAGLDSITAVAAKADVSTPTVARLVQKLGFKGYPEFHRALLSELQAKLQGPTQRRQKWAAEAPDTHLLNRFAVSVTKNIETTFSNVESKKFETAAALLIDGSAPLYIVGGRITRSLAEYAYNHLQVVRPMVVHLTGASANWPHFLLDMKEGDVLLMFDIRRYETNLERIAEAAAGRNLKIILITDQWTSPAARWADHVFNCWVEIPSAWDSNVSTLMLLEALISAAQEQKWADVQERLDRLDGLFDLTTLFYKT